jgi:hypothetical protein
MPKDWLTPTMPLLLTPRKEYLTFQQHKEHLWFDSLGSLLADQG